MISTQEDELNILRSLWETYKSKNIKELRDLKNQDLDLFEFQYSTSMVTWLVDLTYSMHINYVEITCECSEEYHALLQRRTY